MKFGCSTSTSSRARGTRTRSTADPGRARAVRARRPARHPSTCWEVEHHFLEEYSHSSAPEVFLAAASQRTKNIRLGHGIVQTPPRFNHPARVAERIATLDLVSNGRVDFGTGESSSEAELGGFLIDPAEKREMWEEGLRARAVHDRGAVHRRPRASTSPCRRATSCPSRARSRTRRCGSRAAGETRSTSPRRRASARSRSRSSIPRKRRTGSTTTTRRSRTKACRSATP